MFLSGALGYLLNLGKAFLVDAVVVEQAFFGEPLGAASAAKATKDRQKEGRLEVRWALEKEFDLGDVSNLVDTAEQFR